MNELINNIIAGDTFFCRDSFLQCKDTCRHRRHYNPVSSVKRLLNFFCNLILTFWHIHRSATQTLYLIHLPHAYWLSKQNYPNRQHTHQNYKAWTTSFWNKLISTVQQENEVKSLFNYMSRDCMMHQVITHLSGLWYSQLHTLSDHSTQLPQDQTGELIIHDRFICVIMALLMSFQPLYSGEHWRGRET